MANESAFDVRLTDFRLTPLAPDAALLNYRATDSSNGSATLRSSLWVHRDGRWQMLFHQGTLSARKPFSHCPSVNSAVRPSTAFFGTSLLSPSYT